MDAALQRRVQRYGWDKAAGYYEEFWQHQLEPAQSLLLEMADLRPGESVLDIACGTGLVSFRAADAVGEMGSVMGADISDAMVGIARQTAAHRNIRNVDFERMDAEQLSIEDESFDVVLCSLGLMYVPDSGRALTEMFRCVKPGGRVLAAVWGERSNCGWAEIFPIVDRRVASEVCPLFFQLGTGDSIKYRFESAGLTDVVIVRIATTLSYSGPDDACGAAFAGGPVALAYSRFDERVRREAQEEYLASIEPFRSGGGYSIPGEFVVARGFKKKN